MATRHSGTPGDPVNAGFWRRCAARLVDSLVVGAVSALLMAVVRAVFGMETADSWIGDLEGLAIGWLYVASQESSAAQATLGKRLMGLKVTDEHGDRIGFGRATFRFFFQMLSAVIAGIGFMMAGWTARKQALHDILAGTLVVFRDMNLREPARRPSMPWYGWALNIAGIALASCLVAAVALTTETYGAYLARAQLMEALVSGERAQLAIDDFYREAKRCPASADEAGFDQDMTSAEIFDVAIEPECHVAIEFSDSSAAKAPLRGQRIDLTMVASADESGLPTWKCTSTVYASYRPATCRD